MDDNQIWKTCVLYKSEKFVPESMVSQYIWIGITVGVFIAGIGIGFAALQNSSSVPMMMSSQQMPEMMSDPEFRQHMRDSMGQNR